MSNKKGYIIRNIIVILLGVYLSNIFTNILMPKIQIFVDTEKIFLDNSTQVFLYNEKHLNIFPNENGVYMCSLELYSQPYELEFQMNGDQLTNCKINGKEFYNIDKISNYTTVDIYKHTYCIKLNAVSLYHYLILFILSLTWIAILGYIVNKEIFCEGKYDFSLTYSRSAIKYVGWKAVIISIVIALTSTVIHYGCDLHVLSSTIILYQKGIDFYQMFAALNEYKNPELLMWQYDGSMLAGYNLFSYLLYPFLSLFNPHKYHLIQAVGYKLINISIYNALVLSVISYLIDNGFMAKEKAKQTYYFSVFNPLTFYVAIVFIQFDVIPAYCITLGILHLQKLNKNKILSAVLIAYGISCKMTLFLFIPTVFFLILFIVVKEIKESRKPKVIYIATICVLFTIMLLLPRLLNTPLSIALSNLAQAERIWFTAIQYAPTLFLFVAIFSLIVLFIINVYDINLRMRKETMIINALYSIGSIVLIFSFSTISTPAFYIQTIPAFVLLYAASNDKFQSLWTALIGCLIASAFMFVPEGDITASLSWFGLEPIFTTIKNMAISSGNEIRWFSLLHTISASVMFAYAVIFAKKAKEIVKKEAL